MSRQIARQGNPSFDSHSRLTAHERFSSTRGHRLGPHERLRSKRLQIRDLSVHDMHIAMRAAGEFCVVRHHHDRRPPPIDLLEKVDDLTRHQRIEIAGRLVGEQKSGAPGQRSCNRHSLLLTAGQLGGNVLHARSEPDEFERLRDALLALARVHAAIPQGHIDVVEQVEVRNQIEALKNEADLLIANARTRVVRQPADVFAVELVGPRSNVSSRPAMFRNVVLPEPDGPVTATNSPSFDFETEVTQRVRLDEIRAEDLADVVH